MLKKGVKMSEKKLGSNILSLNASEYASFLGIRFDEFEKIADSGYGLYWFPQCFYLHWQERKKLDDLELWGNMGRHYISSKVSQFSEVMVAQIDAEYKSDIFILALLGLEKNIRKELFKIKNHIYKSELVLPFKVFLIRFDRLVATEKDPNAVNPDLLFKDLDWIPPFRANLWKRLHLVSIGVLEGSFQSYIDKLGG